MKDEHKIHTGSSKKIKVDLFASLKVIYSGMPSENIFSITPLFLDMNWGYAAPVIYYPKDSSKIFILDYRFKVKEVTPNYIILIQF